MDKVDTDLSSVSVLEKIVRNLKRTAELGIKTPATETAMKNCLARLKEIKDKEINK